MDAATRAAADYGFECCIVQDGCATRRLKFGDRMVAAADVHVAFLSALNAYGRVMTAEALLAELGLNA